MTVKVDTGAKCNVLSRELASNITKTQKAPIRINSSQRAKIITYGGDSFYTMGSATLNVEHNSKNTQLVFHIVNKRVTSLLGLQDSLKLNLITLNPSVAESNPDDLAQVHFETSDLFNNKLGKTSLRSEGTRKPSQNKVQIHMYLAAKQPKDI